MLLKFCPAILPCEEEFRQRSESEHSALSKQRRPQQAKNRCDEAAIFLSRRVQILYRLRPSLDLNHGPRFVLTGG